MRIGWRKVGHPFIRDLEREIVGHYATIEHPEGSPIIHFGDNFTIVAEAPWRLIDSRRVVVARDDDGQWFGLSEPVDAPAEANSHLSNKKLKSVEFGEATGDIRLKFAGALVLEIMTNSSGYESWVMFRKGEHFAVGGSGGLI